MKYEEQYDRWRKRRTNVPVPAGFADRVMASVHQRRQRVWWLVVQQVAAAMVRSRLACAAAGSLAIAVWLIRIAAILAVFACRTSCGFPC